MFKNFNNLFFKNIGVRQTIAKNTFWLMSADAFSRILNMGLLIYSARILGATEYGRFTFVLSFVSLLVVFSDFGIFEIITKEFSGAKEVAQDYPSIFSLKMFLSLFSLAIMLLGSLIITDDFMTRKAIWVLSVFILITSFFNIIFSFFRARQKMEYEAFFLAVQASLIATIGFFILFKIPSALNLAVGYLVANAVVLALMLIIFHFFIFKIKLGFDKHVWQKFLSSSWPLTFGFATGWMYIYINSVVMGYLGQLTQAGWYNAAFKISGAAIIVAVIISRSFFPALSKLYKESKEKFLKIWTYQAEIMGTMAFPVLFGGFILAPKIIAFFYGIDYAPSVSAFRLLLFVCALNLIYYPYAMAMIIFDKQKWLFYDMLIGVVLNTVLTIVLVPYYSYIGASVSAIISSLVTFLLVVAHFAKSSSFLPINLKILKSIFYSVIASTIMVAIISYRPINTFNIFALIPIGALVYFGVLLFFYRKPLTLILMKLKAAE